MYLIGSSSGVYEAWLSHVRVHMCRVNSRWCVTCIIAARMKRSRERLEFQLPLYRRKEKKRERKREDPVRRAGNAARNRNFAHIIVTCARTRETRGDQPQRAPRRKWMSASESESEGEKEGRVEDARDVYVCVDVGAPGRSAGERETVYLPRNESASEFAKERRRRGSNAGSYRSAGHGEKRREKGQSGGRRKIKGARL